MKAVFSSRHASNKKVSRAKMSEIMIKTTTMFCYAISQNFWSEETSPLPTFVALPLFFNFRSKKFSEKAILKNELATTVLTPSIDIIYVVFATKVFAFCDLLG